MINDNNIATIHKKRIYVPTTSTPIATLIYHLAGLFGWGLVIALKENLLVIHDGIEDFINGVQDVHAEGTFIVGFLLLSPLLGLWVEEVLSPKTVHEFYYINLEFLSIHFSKLFESESPSVETRTETYGAFAGIDLEKQ